MLFRQLFLDAISNELNGMDYYLKDNSFYIYKREAGVVLCISFDVFSNGSDFWVGAGAEDFSSSIEQLPNGQLSVRCYDVNEYAPRHGLQAIDNCNVSPENFLPKRHSKSTLLPKLHQNMNLLRNSLLKDLLSIETPEDYYRFRVRGDGMHHVASIPFPTISSFFLCVSLGKLREASHVYLMMLRRQDRNICAIDECMQLKPSDRILGALDECYDPTPSNKNRNTYEQLEKEAKAIETVLNEYQKALLAETQRRIDSSRTVCDAFFNHQQA